MASLASQLGAARPEAIDDTLVDGLRQIAELLRLDRATLWRLGAAGSETVASHDWSRYRQPVAFEALASIPSIASKLEAQEAAWFTRLEDMSDAADRAVLLQLGIRSAAVIPMTLTGGDRDERGALVLGSTTLAHEWTPAAIPLLRLASTVFGHALARTRDRAALQRALEEIRRLREGVSREDESHRPGLNAPLGSRLIVSNSAAMQSILRQLAQVAPTPATVLLLGETGAGKDVIAQAIHDASPRRQRQMIRVSCAAIPSALIESELFGRERGAYTGALTRQIGRFEAADQSTIFLDEIGELPAEVQVKLLCVLQDRVVVRLGSTHPIKVDVRIIAATNRNLEKAVEDKTFREDLFYRLNVFPVVVPPLRDRIEDIPGLVWAFVDEFAKSFGKPIDLIAKESMSQLQCYGWPGNVRELRNVIERAMILSTDRRLTIPIPEQGGLRRVQRPLTLADLETEQIRNTLESTNWRIRGADGAAERLGLKPTTLESRIARLGLVRPGREHAAARLASR